jgi:hypothetical protein
MRRYRWPLSPRRCRRAVFAAPLSLRRCRCAVVAAPLSLRRCRRAVVAAPSSLRRCRCLSSRHRIAMVSLHRFPRAIVAVCHLSVIAAPFMPRWHRRVVVASPLSPCHCRCLSSRHRIAPLSLHRCPRAIVAACHLAVLSPRQQPLSLRRCRRAVVAAPLSARRCRRAVVAAA